ncbi:ArsR/SmtB family transcription factor [Aestuariispira ectoiniformans]|uniref:ArsR/SmtB family transcription factor n=1 Tax=Aestuariispira ectoiniformans TaxID=2775080 RepID=UPI00223BD029|nr:metalloregulator ArsR/SmtB family transcription factor [Aestuariispira ectoiniformans]
MSTNYNLATIGALIGDPSRALMLSALQDGCAWTAGELASAAGVSNSTASEHLAKLVDGNLLTVCKQGRHRYYNLASPQVADALEALSLIPSDRPRRKPSSPVPKPMREARCCYDHLAGRVAIGLADALSAQGYLDLAENNFSLRPEGEIFLSGLGLDIGAMRTKKRHFARACLDWSERRYHIAGSLGAGLLTLFLDRHWARRSQTDRRLITITPAGFQELESHLHLSRYMPEETIAK